MINGFDTRSQMTSQRISQCRKSDRDGLYASNKIRLPLGPDKRNNHFRLDRRFRDWNNDQLLFLRAISEFLLKRKGVKLIFYPLTCLVARKTFKVK